MKFGLAPPADIQTVDELEAYLKEFEAHVRKLDTPILGGPRRHHYIPQFYLRRFANNGKRLIRMPLPAHPPPSRKPTNVEKLAVVKDFYTVLTEKGESAVKTAAVRPQFRSVVWEVSPLLEEESL